MSVITLNVNKLSTHKSMAEWIKKKLLYCLEETHFRSKHKQVKREKVKKVSHASN